MKNKLFFKKKKKKEVSQIFYWIKYSQWLRSEETCLYYKYDVINRKDMINRKIESSLERIQSIYKDELREVRKEFESKNTVLTSY